MAPSELTLGKKMFQTPLLPTGLVAEQLSARAQMFVWNFKLNGVSLFDVYYKLKLVIRTDYASEFQCFCSFGALLYLGSTFLQFNLIIFILLITTGCRSIFLF
jgi:hypothetical protein